MTEFKVGDVVRIRGIAGPNMVVARVEGPTFKLWYFLEGKLEEIYSPAGVLEPGAKNLFSFSAARPDSDAS